MHFQLTVCFFAGTVWSMPKPKKEQITIRVLPETIGAINELADRNGITKGDALDLLVLRGLDARAKAAERITAGNRCDPSQKEPTR